MSYRVFISSVQEEFNETRQELYTLFEQDNLLKHYFTPYLFENDRVKGKSPKSVYIDEVGKSDIYLMLCGKEYGYEDSDGISPTEHEYSHATAMGLERWVFLKDLKGNQRHPKEDQLIERINRENKRAVFRDHYDLSQYVIDAAIGFLQEKGELERKVFDTAIHKKAEWKDIDEEQIERFENLSRSKGRLNLPRGIAHQELIYRLHLMSENNELTNAALMAFAHSPERFFPAAFVKCVQFYGKEVAKPLADERMIYGNIFHQIEQSYQYVLGKLNRQVSTNSQSTSADVTYEIPPLALREAIVNALAHRDYNSLGSVQIMLFKDRLEISNPGRLYPPLNVKMLERKHLSYPPNQLLADTLRYTADIEQMGTGTQDIFRECKKAGLKKPVISLAEGFSITLYRPKVAEPDPTSSPQLPHNYPTTTTELPRNYHGTTTQVAELIKVLEEEMSITDLLNAMALKNREHLRKQYLVPAIEQGLINMKYPNSPNHPRQRYLLTEAGKELKNQIKTTQP